MHKSKVKNHRIFYDILALIYLSNEEIQSGKNSIKFSAGFPRLDDKRAENLNKISVICFPILIKTPGLIGILNSNFPNHLGT